MSTTGADVNALLQNQDQTGPSIGDLEDDEVIRCRDTAKLVWYYATDRESIVLFHEWNKFEPVPRSAFSATTVIPMSTRQR